jgi:xanthine/uracil/vitamin C permease (AzgA family)
MNILPERNRCPCLTYDARLGLCTGFVIYPHFMAAAGKIRDIRPGTWGLTAIALVFLVGRPY